jgi:hypothetical protein
MAAGAIPRALTLTGTRRRSAGRKISTTPTRYREQGARDPLAALCVLSALSLWTPAAGLLTGW